MKITITIEDERAPAEFKSPEDLKRYLELQRQKNPWPAADELQKALERIADRFKKESERQPGVPITITQFYD